MKPHSPEWALLEVSDIIRVNQLVRARTDTGAFEKWYRGLSLPEQTALTVTLIEFAGQAEPNELEWQKAIEVTGLIKNPELIERLRAYVGGTYFRGDNSLHFRWLHAASETDRAAAFWLAAHLFGLAERRRFHSCRVFRAKMKDHCTHWWHQDLLDDRVVEAILSDPNYYMTSMKNDDRIK